MRLTRSEEGGSLSLLEKGVRGPLTCSLGGSTHHVVRQVVCRVAPGKSTTLGQVAVVGAERGPNSLLEGEGLPGTPDGVQHFTKHRGGDLIYRHVTQQSPIRELEVKHMGSESTSVADRRLARPFAHAHLVLDERRHIVS
jgi:hypothetical protein